MIVIAEKCRKSIAEGVAATITGGRGGRGIPLLLGGLGSYPLENCENKEQNCGI